MKNPPKFLQELRGIKPVNLLLLTAAVSALLKIGLDMEKLLGLSTAVTLLSAVAQLAARVLYLHFLWQSARCLSARD